MTPIPSYSSLASSLSFFPLLAPNFYYCAHTEEENGDLAFLQENLHWKSKNHTADLSGFPFPFQKRLLVYFLKFTDFSTVHDR